MSHTGDYAHRRKQRLADRMRSASDPVEAARLAAALYYSCYKSTVRQDEEEPAAWITTENKHRVPLDENGIAMGGGGGTLEGIDFSNAETSPAPTTEKSSESKASNKPAKESSENTVEDKFLSPKQYVEKTMKGKGYTQKDIDEVSEILDRHTAGHELQKKADAEIAEHIATGDKIGKYLADKADMEEKSWQREIDKKYERDLKDYEYRLFSLKMDRENPDGIYKSFTDEDLKDYGIWPKEPVREEPYFYRKGGMDKDVLSFSTSEDGANMTPITQGESGAIGYDVRYTLEEMENMGYRPIAGIASMDVGYSGESEVLFAKFPTTEEKSVSRTTRAHDVGMQELASLKVGSELRLSDGKTFKVTEDSGERWLEGSDGSAYSLDMDYEIQSFVEEYGNARDGSLKKAKITSPSSEPTESDLQEYRNKMENAYSADSPQDFDEMYRNQTAEIWKSLDKETKDAVADYTGHTYLDINKSLRDGNDSEYAGDISKITDTIEKSELQDDTLLYRGADAQGFENLMGMSAGSLTPENVGQLVGKTGEEKGFMSTCSTSGGIYYKGSKVQMEILAPAGTKALYVEPFAAYSGGRKWNGETGQSTYSGEDETIVQRGSSLTVLSADYDESSKTYKLQMAITWQNDVSNNDSRSDSTEIRALYRRNRKKRMVQRMRASTGREAARLATLIYNEFYRTSHGDADDAEEGDKRWITTENGEHMLIDNNSGEVVAGAGGALNGKKFTNAKSTSKPVKRESGKAKRKSKSKVNTSEPQTHKTVTAKDLLKSYNGPSDTKSIIEAQGFGGLPKVVEQDEFDKAVKASKFIAQRTYSASDQETLDKYQQMLYEGDFYVDCTDGGSQYGQGMYCAADYNGELSSGIKSEMNLYTELNQERYVREKLKELTADDCKKTKAYENMPDSSLPTEEELSVFNKHDSISGNWKTATKEERDLYDEMEKNGKAFRMKSARIELAKQISDEYKAPVVCETLTLDPSAKIVKFEDLIAERDKDVEMLKKLNTDKMMEDVTAYINSAAGDEEDKEGMMAYARGRITGSEEDWEKSKEWWHGKATRTQKSDIMFAVGDAKKAHSQEADKVSKMDIGAYAALKGYDAINAEGVGESGSYTVILNRTKMIMLDNRGHADAAEEGGDTWEFKAGENGIVYAYKNGKQTGWVMPSAVSKKAS